MEERGRREIAAVIGIMIGTSLLVILFTSILQGGVEMRQVVRLALTLGLAAALWRARPWARWVNGVLAVLGALGFLFVVAGIGNSIPLAAAALVISFAYFWCAWALLFSPNVAAWFHHQNEPVTLNLSGARPNN